ncbi:2-isopropylmalate synthase [Actinokineospora auranticolor]|uniref:2-isopropylmalate synthase n=1 Tax=Actinokineospora auranticolor TaxID=155976 RepID=A0A2S6GAY8_9PSEU|nr:2-isopropylmalate synthase [Actinokineospora auranticolor]PPK60436.1 2-isopropylmalate synthase [Actinokineospora auranticolor]
MTTTEPPATARPAGNSEPPGNRLPYGARHRSAAAQRASSMPAHKYRQYRPLGLPDRQWPDRVATRAPLWCSVDLRDGNQALLDPMTMASRQELFRLLVRLGFKEIEVGMPVSCRADHDFVRWLARSGEVPDDVTPQVLVPMRPDLIAETVRALRGLPRAIMQVFHPTSTVQRRVVFRATRAEVKRLALNGAELSMRLRDGLPGTRLSLQYGPESFTQTEPEFALEVCNAVLDLWRPTADDDVRINLPATVEAFPAHEFADRIEWMHRNLVFRDRILLGLHPHNDRGCGVAAAEAALLAGADRVEGTLFGNGERSGNVCLVTLAMNLFSQGIDPRLELGGLDDIRRVAERCTRIPVACRHPWAGELVYTSLAGSHQDAIAKGLRDRDESGSPLWEVPYLPIDPHDIGRDYQALVRISNQSGKGGLAYLMRTEHGLELPRGVQVELAEAVGREMDDRGGELDPAALWRMFARHFLPPVDQRWMGLDPEEVLTRLAERTGVRVQVLDVIEQPSATPASACATFCQVRAGRRTKWGVGIAGDRAVSRLSAVYSGLHRLGALVG